MILYDDEIESLNQELKETRGSKTLRGGLANDPKFRELLPVLFLYSYTTMPPVMEGQDYVILLWHPGGSEPEDYYPGMRVVFYTVLLLVGFTIWLNT